MLEVAESATCYQLDCLAHNWVEMSSIPMGLSCSPKGNSKYLLVSRAVDVLVYLYSKLALLGQVE